MVLDPGAVSVGYSITFLNQPPLSITPIYTVRFDQHSQKHSSDLAEFQILLDKGASISDYFWSLNQTTNGDQL